jgi:hypothetical protein
MATPTVVEQIIAHLRQLLTEEQQAQLEGRFQEALDKEKEALAQAEQAKTQPTQDPE